MPSIVCLPLCVCRHSGQSGNGERELERQEIAFCDPHCVSFCLSSPPLSFWVSSSYSLPDHCAVSTFFHRGTRGRLTKDRPPYISVYVHTFAPHLHFACQPPRPFVLRQQAGKQQSARKKQRRRRVARCFYPPLMVHFGKKKDSLPLQSPPPQLQKFLRRRGMSRVESELELAGRIMNPFHLDDGAVEREKMSLPPPSRLISGSWKENKWSRNTMNPGCCYDRHCESLS